MVERLEKKEWEKLIRNINMEMCTPFLGAGACSRQIPIGTKLADEWARTCRYPMSDSSDLPRVSQYIAIQEGDMEPKLRFAELCRSAQNPDYNGPNEIHSVLADLPCKVYITTNYDDFIVEALRKPPRNRKCRHELCQWNGYVEENWQSVFKEDPTYVPSVEDALVYHLHGCHQMPQSLVLTEDDYLDFLVRMSRDTTILPAAVKKALAGTSLLFVGYSLSDWTFRVLFRALMSSLGGSLGMTSVAVQLSPSPVSDKASDEDRQKAKNYLESYFSKIQKIRVTVYWGDVSDFAAELRANWEASDHGRQAK
jgi:hypothetical protein